MTVLKSSLVLLLVPNILSPFSSILLVFTEMLNSETPKRDTVPSGFIVSIIWSIASFALDVPTHSKAWSMLTSSGEPRLPSTFCLQR